MNPWTEKHRPKKFPEVIGQEEAIEKTKKFIENFPSKKRTLLLHGPSGVGKTTLAYATANETQSEIFELNASDFRDKNKLNEILKPAIEQTSLGKKSKIILIDEVDGIFGTDRGGIPELIKLIESTKHPIIITANDVWSKKLSTLRQKCELINLKEIHYSKIRQTLIDILRKENKFINNNILTEISIKSKGDLRGAINELQTISKLKKPEEAIIQERESKKDIFNALKKILQLKPDIESLKTFDQVDMPLDEIMLWVEENIPKAYKQKELARAYELLSKADLFKGRIYKQQYWRFLVYENIFLSYGISSAKEQIKNSFTKYKKPTRILKIWMNNQRNLKKKSISEKYAKYSHISKKRAMHEFPIIKQVLNSNPLTYKELNLTDEEVEYLRV